MKLESLKNDLFAPMSANEAAMIKGGLQAAAATSSTVWSNTFVDGGYIGLDKDIFSDPAQQAPVSPELIA
jgi:hypothetical protein